MKYTIKLLAIISILCVVSCTRPDKAREVLESRGYTHIEITGWEPLMAGKDDTFSTGFRAISPSGTVVEGAVTGGVFKGSTIRIK